MIESFPYTQSRTIDKIDFFRFSEQFKSVVRAKIPSAEPVHFLEDGAGIGQLAVETEGASEIAAVLRDISSGQKKAAIRSDCILFGIPVAGDEIVVCLVSHLDRLLLERAAMEWLLELREGVRNDFSRIRSRRVDPETGLLNSRSLFSLLEDQSPESPLTLFLVEVPPRGRYLRGGFRHARQVANALLAATDGQFLIYYLGQCVFVIAARSDEIGVVEKFSSGLVHLLKRDGFYRVHIGSSSGGGDGGTDRVTEAGGRVLLDRAWTALQTASRRGPFSFCDYRLLVNGEDHPLRSLEARVQRRIQRLCRPAGRFCLAKVGGEGVAEAADDLCRLTAERTDVAVVPAHDGLFLVFPGQPPQEAVTITRELLVQLGALAKCSALHAGVSYFPCNQYNRAAVIANAQKALLHGAFLGAGGVALFDAVSLNVAGDVYFGEGDLPKAVREYRQGLSLDGDDVNLLNSLGVSYALLGKNGLARRCFERALVVDGADHMALYNLGLGAQLRGDFAEALERFELALRSCDGSAENEGVKRDLKLQLGRLHCNAGRYRQALAYLEEWRAEVSERRQGGIYRYLGEAFRGLDQRREAMTWLHRALRHDPNDCEALSLLGITILEEREGDDIALSLCGKSVELAPDNSQLRLRLARVQLAVGDCRAALESLGHCRGGRVDRQRVQLLKAETYQRLGQSGRAIFWVKKVLAQGEDGTAARQAKALLESMKQPRMKQS